MLNPNELKNQIKQGIQSIIVPAVKTMIRSGYPETSSIGDEVSEDQSKVFDDLVSDQFAEILANAIDYYVKNIAISGIIITTGSPVTQQAVITPNKVPTVNGKLPNTLGIS